VIIIVARVARVAEIRLGLPQPIVRSFGHMSC
jgi:hypothetical protein